MSQTPLSCDANFYRDSTKKYPVITHGKGVYLYDKQGREYMDFGSGIAVSGIGYSVPEVTRKIAAQLERITFVWNGNYTNEPRQTLSAKLMELLPATMGGVIFACGGSEANEIAIKIARQYHCERGHDSKYKVISRQASFHGNTMCTLAVSDRPSWSDMFAPYMPTFPKIPVPYCYRCPLGLQCKSCNLACARALEDVIQAEGSETISAFMAEPIVGTTLAAVTPPEGYYECIRKICHRHDVLFIADEVICGLGRTGRTLGLDHWDVTADITTLAKGLSAGYAPLSATVLSQSICETIRHGSGRHTQGFTYSGNPLGTQAGLAVLQYIQDHDLIAQAAARGEFLHAQLQTLLQTEIVGEIRGRGMLYGLEFVADPQTKQPFPAEAGFTRRILTKALERGLMLIGGMPGCVDGVNGDQLQLTPAFIFTEEQIVQAVEILRQVILDARDEVRHL